MNTYSTLLTGIENAILTITINRPDKLNALNHQVMLDIDAAMNEVYSNNEIRSVIITGSGEKSFVAGADIAEFANFSVAEGKQLAATGHFKIFNFIENYSKPVIAAINGFALGGGLELAMCEQYSWRQESDLYL